ncbi:ABC transporter ATP-binding protein [Mumia zhuanghuii]|uniref:ABC transporter ATP-binding protein n=2 Tax=Mumia TaxID=1546255 RepID=A0ABW1QJ40_9ACTN|nr:MULTISPECIES: ABC transporter ATP-binding protein [Mumia]KAA1423695.1 ABC transporter ATP-binding protein [Mumia zhuanghuii]
MTEPIISVQDISIRFHRSRRHRSLRDLLFKGESGVRAGEFWGLRHISFDVQPGEAIGVVGRNGQGKSTLLKTIAGVLIPDEGRVNVNGGVAPLIEITGGFVGDLTVRDNIYLAAGLHGMGKKQIAASFEEIVEFAEIEDFVDTPYKHLSSGMKVRVAFSVVSRLDEPIMLVDEVLAVGDRAFREKCFERIDEMLSQGRTLFMVSHSEANLTRFCTRGLYLREGTLVLDGPIQEVVDQYFSDSGDEAALRRRHERRMRRMRRLGLLNEEDEEEDDGDEDNLRTVV